MEKCYCEVALQDGYDCALIEWKPEDPKAFQQAIVNKIESALMNDWGEDRSGKLCLPDMIVCPAEALWIAKALKANIKLVGIRKASIKATKA
jgi:hypothetical protein